MMEDGVAKERVLKAIINALEVKDGFDQQLRQDIADDFFPPIAPDAAPLTFAENFVDNGGTFIFCEDSNDMINKLQMTVKKYNLDNIFCNKSVIKAYLEQAALLYKQDIDSHDAYDTGIMFCECLVARHGSVVVSAASKTDAKLLSASNNIIFIANIGQVVSEIKDAIKLLKDKYYNSFPPYITMLTGPSKTNSIENQLVVGGQGAKKIFLFLINETQH